MIDFGAVLNPVDADNFFAMINPLENPPVADAEFAETGQVFGHSNEPPVNHDGGVFRQPENFTFDACADCGVEFNQLRVCARAYFDPVGHDKCRGFQLLNLPASSSLRASRSSAITLGFCAVSQS